MNVPKGKDAFEDYEDLAKVAAKAIESWLDEDIVGFEHDEG
ncbi:hypothetical protein OAK38_09515 [Verrucomicrobia bacterium]|nr:hypothetical protein [Verrucomicrobiota bacterium]